MLATDNWTCDDDNYFVLSSKEKKLYYEIDARAVLHDTYFNFERLLDTPSDEIENKAGTGSSRTSRDHYEDDFQIESTKQTMQKSKYNGRWW